VSAGQFDAGYAGTCDTYDPFQGNEAAHMDLDAMLRSGQWGTFGNFQGVWKMEEQ
jgi:hypothetical protein